MTYRFRRGLGFGLAWLAVAVAGCDDDESSDFQSNNGILCGDEEEADGTASNDARGAAANAIPETNYSASMGGSKSSASAKSTSGAVGNVAATGTNTSASEPRDEVAAGGTPNVPDPGAAGAAGMGTLPDQCGLLDATKPLELYLSSDDSNSMASATIARYIINKGQVPPADKIRTYEFMNYYDLKYERAGAGQLAISLEMAVGDTVGTYALQVGVSSEAAAFVRRPMNITFVLDTSGSMSGEPIERSRATIKAIAASLKLGDIVSAVTWNNQNTVEMDSHSVSGPNDPDVIALADAMQANGSTNLNAGLNVGYTIAQKNFVASHLNRVVLISDGQANTGVTDEQIIAQGASLNDGDGVYLVGVGVGDGVNDTLMNTVTDKGRGAYVYLDTIEEAARMFTTRFDETMDVAARSVQVRLDLPWYLGVVRFSGEQMSTNAKDVEPQHLAPNDAMVFNQVLRPCAAERFAATDPVTVTANWITPTTHEPRNASANTTLGALLATSAAHLPKAQAIIAYADALKAGAPQVSITAARAKVAAALALGVDADLQEIDQLLQRLDALRN